MGFKRYKPANSTFATFASSVAPGDVTVNLTSGHGARFAFIGADDFTWGTFLKSDNTYEVVKITARSSDQLTVTRAQDSTTALSFSSGDLVWVTLPTAALNHITTSDDLQILDQVTPSIGGSANAITGTNDPPFAGLTTGLLQVIVPGAEQTSSTPTYTPDGLDTDTIVKGNNLPLDSGDMDENCPAWLWFNGTNWVLLNPIKGINVGQLSVRQSVLTGAISSGAPAFLAAGSGLRLALDATPTALVMAFAAGFGSTGEVNLISQISADDTDIIEADIAATNTTYIYATHSTPVAVTWANTIVPPQYGDSYNKTRNSLVHFNGSDAATSFTDDYGNTWTVAADAQLDTAQQKFGTASLLLDGTGDYAQSTSFTGLGEESWTMEGWVRFAALPGSGAAMVLVEASNAGNFGVQLRVHNNAGTYQFRVDASSNGTTNNLANATTSDLATPSTNTWYHWAITYDALADRIRTYFDGTAEHAINPSGSFICGVAKIRLGMSGAGASGLNGHIDEFRLSPCCRYPNGTTFTPSASAFSVEGHWFSIQEMKMYEVTSASASAGVNPGMTQRNRLFVAEADTDASSVTAVRNYAYRGRAVVDQTGTLAVSTRYTMSHNIGVEQIEILPLFVCNSVQATPGYTSGEIVQIFPNFFDGTSIRRYGIRSSKNIASISTDTHTLIVPNRNAADCNPTTYANWNFRLICTRGW